MMLFHGVCIFLGVLVAGAAVTEGVRREREYWKKARHDFETRFPDSCWECSKGRAFHYLPEPHEPCVEKSCPTP